MFSITAAFRSEEGRAWMIVTDAPVFLAMVAAALSARSEAWEKSTATRSRSLGRMSVHDPPGRGRRRASADANARVENQCAAGEHLDGIEVHFSNLRTVIDERG